MGGNSVMDEPVVIPDFVALEVGLLHLRLVSTERQLAKVQAENKELQAQIEKQTSV